MLNIRVPGEKKRRLFENAVMSVLTYGAPVWYDELISSKRIQVPFNRVIRTLALRVISAYKTVSFEAATFLARVPPLYLTASLRKRVFLRLRDLRRSEDWYGEAKKEIRTEENILFKKQWRIHASEPNLAGVRTREAVLPNFKGWIERKHGAVFFHLTQLLSGHGCFNSYLHKIGKADSPICAHCEQEEDTTEHTLQRCIEWLAERDELKRAVGKDLTLGIIVGAMIASRDAWAAVGRFAATVMFAKEEAERERQAADAAIIDDDTEDED